MVKRPSVEAGHVAQAFRTGPVLVSDQRGSQEPKRRYHPSRNRGDVVSHAQDWETGRTPSHSPTIAAARDWDREVERHRCTSQRVEKLLADLGQPLDGLCDTPEGDDPPR